LLGSSAPITIISAPRRFASPTIAVPAWRAGTRSALTSTESYSSATSFAR
jgi:hypothetical protein